MRPLSVALSCLHVSLARTLIVTSCLILANYNTACISVYTVGQATAERAIVDDMIGRALLLVSQCSDDPSDGSTPTTCGTAVGEAHLGGVERLLQEPQMLAACDACAPSDQDMSDVASAEDYGVRLALLESALRLSCRPEVSSPPNTLLF